jgi:hypothetical protein
MPAYDEGRFQPPAPLARVTLWRLGEREEPPVRTRT